MTNSKAIVTLAIAQKYLENWKNCAKQTGKSMLIGTDTILFVLKSL